MSSTRNQRKMFGNIIVDPLDDQTLSSLLTSETLMVESATYEEGTTNHVAAPDAITNMGVECITMPQITGRYYPIAPMDWTSNMTEWQTVMTMDWPDIMKTTSYPFASIIEMHAYMRADIDVVIQINPSPFHQGALIVYYVPDNVLLNMSDNGSIFLFPHAVIDARNNTAVRLRVPYTSNYQALDTLPGATDSSRMGTIRVEVLSPLITITGNSETLKLQTYVRAPKMEFYAMTYSHAVTSDARRLPALHGDREERGDCPVPTPRQRGGWRGAVSEGLVEDAAEQAQPSSAPQPDQAPVALVSDFTSNIAPGAEQFPDLLEIAKTPGVVWSGNWLGTKPAGGMMAHGNVSPVQDCSLGGARSLCPLTSLAMRYAYWRGSIKFRLQVYCTQFHRGRVALVWIPGDLPATPSQFSFARTCKMWMLDLGEADALDIVIPYASMSDYLMTWGDANLIGDSGSRTSTGRIAMYVVTPLTTIATVAPNVHLQLFMSAGDDFTLHRLHGVSVCTSFPQNDGSEAGYFEEEFPNYHEMIEKEVLACAEALEVQRPGAASVGTNSQHIGGTPYQLGKPVPLSFMGPSETNLSELVKRPRMCARLGGTTVGTSNWRSGISLIHGLTGEGAVPGFQGIQSSYSPITDLLSFFWWHRADIIFKIGPLANDTTITMSAAPVTQYARTSVLDIGGVWTNGIQSANAELVVPYQGLFPLQSRDRLRYALFGAAAFSPTRTGEHLAVSCSTPGHKFYFQIPGYRVTTVPPNAFITLGSMPRRRTPVTNWDLVPEIRFRTKKDLVEEGVESNPGPCHSKEMARVEAPVRMVLYNRFEKIDEMREDQSPPSSKAIKTQLVRDGVEENPGPTSYSLLSSYQRRLMRDRRGWVVDYVKHARNQYSACASHSKKQFVTLVTARSHKQLEYKLKSFVNTTAKAEMMQEERDVFKDTLKDVQSTTYKFQNVADEARKTLRLMQDVIATAGVKAENLFKSVSDAVHGVAVDVKEWAPSSSTTWFTVKFVLYIFLICQGMSWTSTFLVLTLIGLDVAVNIAEATYNVFFKKSVEILGQVVNNNADGVNRAEGIEDFFPAVVRIGLVIAATVSGTGSTNLDRACDWVLPKIRSVGSIKSGIDMIVTIVKGLCSTIKYAFDFFKIDTAEKVAAKYYEENETEILRLMDEMDEILENETLTSIRANVEQRMKLAKLVIAVNSIVRAISTMKPIPPILMALNMRINKLLALHRQVLITGDGAQGRPEPVCILLHGEPGQGKSLTSKQLAKDICALWNIDPQSSIFSRSAVSKFFDGYAGQPIVIIDDLGSCSDGEDYIDLMQMISCTPYQVNMASLDEKGTAFTSPLIIASTNMPSPQPPTINDHTALWRRFHFHMHVQAATGYIKTSAYAKPVLDYEKAVKDGASKTMACCEYNRTCPEAPNHSVKDYTYNELKLEIKAEVSRRAHLHAVSESGVDMQFAVVGYDTECLARLNTALSEFGVARDGLLDAEKFSLVKEIPTFSMTLLEPGHLGLKDEFFKGSVIQPNKPIEIYNVDIIIIPRALEGLAPAFLAHLNRFEGALVLHESKFRDNPTTARSNFDRLMYAKYQFTTDSLVTANVAIRRPDLDQAGVDYLNHASQALKDLIKDTPDPDLVATMLFTPESNWTEYPCKYTMEACQIASAGIMRSVEWGSAFAKRTYNASVTNFQRLMDKVKAKYTSSMGLLMKITAVVAIVLMAAEVIVLYYSNRKTPPAEAAYSAGEPRAPRLPRYQVRPGVARNSAISETQSVLNATTIVQKNMSRITLQTLERSNSMWCLGIKAGVYLVPEHIFKAKELRSSTLIIQMGEAKMYANYKDCTIASLTTGGKPIDLCLVRIPNFSASPRSIAHLFVKTCDLKKIDGHRGCRVFKDYVEQYNHLATEARYTYKCVDGEFITSSGVNYDTITGGGQCGSVVLSNVTTLPVPLVGMHVAGNGSEGFAPFVTFEHIQEGLAALALPDDITVALPTLSEGETRLSEEGSSEILGVADKPLFQNTRTDLRRTELYGLAFEPTRGPAILSPRDYRLELDIDPLMNGMVKYGGDIQCVSDPELKIVAQMIKDDLLPKFYIRPRVLGIDEAINGMGIPEFPGINMQSSPGLPYSQQNRRGGKKSLFVEHPVDFYSMGPDLFDDYFERVELAKVGSIPVSIWQTMLKDELRPLAKVACGKTRVIEGAPLSYTILFRQYFGTFIANMVASHSVETHHMIGTDPEIEWTTMCRDLHKVSPFGFGVDFTNWDGSCSPWQVQVAENVINAYYVDATEEDKLIRRVLLHEVMNTIHQADNTVYRKFKGMPSGHPATSVLNSLFHMALSMLIYRQLARENAPDKIGLMSKYVAFTTYGDDGIYSISGEISEWFHMTAYADACKMYGFKATSEDKDGSAYYTKPLLDIGFLKQKMIPDDEYPRLVHPAIEFKTIEGLANWMRGEATLQGNIDDAAGFAMHHGEDYFEEWSKKIRGAASDARCTIRIPYFEDLRMIWLRKFGIICG